jgi:hypothetical protein
MNVGSSVETAVIRVFLASQKNVIYFINHISSYLVLLLNFVLSKYYNSTKN